MSRVEKLDDCYLIYSPGDMQHVVFDKRWTFNGDYNRPTFRPSMLLNANAPGRQRSHFFVTDGRIEYLSDCDHAMAGQTVEIPEDIRYGEGDY